MYKEIEWQWCGIHPIPETAHHNQIIIRPLREAALIEDMCYVKGLP
jgi:hypothetical protein